MAVYETEIDLKVDLAEEAKKAGEELRLLQKSAQSVQNQLTKANALGDVAAHKKLTDQLGMLDAAMRQLPSSGHALVAMEDAQAKAAKDAAAATKANAPALKKLQNQQKASAEQTLALAEAVTAFAAAAAVAAAAGIAALIYKGAQLAIEASEAKTQMLALFDAMGEGKISGEEVDNLLDDMRSRLGVTKDAMVPFTKQILQMGITSKGAVESMTQAALSAKALTGGADSGAEAFLDMSKKVQLAADTTGKMKLPAKGLSGQFAAMGLNINDVAKEMGTTAKKLQEGLSKGTVDAKKFGDALQNAVTKKGAGPLEAMSLSVGNLGSMLKEYIGDLFEDLGPAIKPFLEEVKLLFGIFDSKAQPSGMALKTGIEGFFKRAFAIATKLVPVVKHFLLDMVIFGLKAYISLKPLLAWFRDLQNNTDFMRGLGLVWDGIVFAVNGLAGGLKVLVAIFGAVAVAVAGTLQMFGAFINWAEGAIDLGQKFVDGLITGITNGAARVVQGVQGLATQAKDAFKKALGIASPSKVMMELGGHVAGGVAEGMSARAPEVYGAGTSLAGAAAAPVAQAGAAPSGGSGGAPQVTVVINGVKGAEELKAEFPQMMAIAFEQLALAGGT